MLPYALQCGMSTEEFWYGEPRVFSSYIKKHELELDEANYKAWLFGLYTYKAVGTVLSNAFSKKSSKESAYFEKPIEELNSFNHSKNGTTKKRKLKKEDYRAQVNHWAKFGKKGV